MLCTLKPRLIHTLEDGPWSLWSLVSGPSLQISERFDKRCPRGPGAPHPQGAGPQSPGPERSDLPPQGEHQRTSNNTARTLRVLVIASRSSRMDTQWMHMECCNPCWCRNVATSMSAKVRKTDLLSNHDKPLKS